MIAKEEACDIISGSPSPKAAATKADANEADAEEDKELSELEDADALLENVLSEDELLELEDEVEDELLELPRTTDVIVHKTKNNIYLCIEITSLI